jgi:hypothetical protein
LNLISGKKKRQRFLSDAFLKQLTTITSCLRQLVRLVRQVLQLVRQVLQQELEQEQQLLLFFHTQQRRAPKSWLQVVTSAF